MSTRAVYTFNDNSDTFHIYKHHDGYPLGAIEFIEKAINFGGEPREEWFEAAELGAAFIAANKDRSGGVYLTHHWQDHGDLEYRYELSPHAGKIWITCHTLPDNQLLFMGTLADWKDYLTKQKDEG